MIIMTLTAVWLPPEHYDDAWEEREIAPYGRAVVSFGDVEVVRLPVVAYFDDMDDAVQDVVARWLRGIPVPVTT